MRTSRGAAGTGNAGWHCERLREDEPDEFAALMAERAVPWGAEPLQHVSACVHHLCCQLTVACQEPGSKARGTIRKLTEKEVATALSIQSTG